MAKKTKYIIRRKDRRIDEVVTESEGLTIGRLPGNDLVLNHRAVDPTHAGIKEIDGQYYIFNLSSSNGVVFNRKLASNLPIEDGGVVQLGPYVLRIEKVDDGLSITVEISVGAQHAENLARQSVKAEESSHERRAGRGLDEQALNIFWEKRKRESGKIAEATPLHPKGSKGKRRMGKALSNWTPTEDLKRPWRWSYFIWSAIGLIALSLVVLLVYREAFSPGKVAFAHRKSEGVLRKIAARANQGSCSACHAVTETIENRCVGCHQTEHFQPVISAAHRAERIGCTGCHTEHEGPDSRAGLLNPNLCANCHNDQYRIKQGINAGRMLGTPHGGSTGYPIVNGRWTWAGWSEEKWVKRSLPAMLAARPVSEQFHAVHRSIYLNSRPGQGKMECRACHASDTLKAGGRDLSPQQACAVCHSAQTSAAPVPLCASCHQPHGGSRDLNRLIAGVSGDFSKLKSFAAAEPGYLSSQAAQVETQRWGGRTALVDLTTTRGWWLALLALAPLIGLVWVAVNTLRRQKELRISLPDSTAAQSDGDGPDEQGSGKLNPDAPVYPHPVVDPLLCIGCHACVEACPHDVLDIVNGVATPVALDQCMEDTSCMVECPTSPKACVVINTTKIIPPRKVPRRNQSLMTNVPGIYLIGDLSGVPLIKNALNEGAQVIDYIVEDLQQAGVEPGSDYDVAIIGIGPAGLSAAAIAKQRGLKYLAIEQDKLGGCVQNYPVGKYVFFKPDTVTARGGVPLEGVGGLKEDLLETWMNSIRQHGLVINEEERCLEIKREEDRFVIMTQKSSAADALTYRARRVILAIGNRGTPMKLGVPGEELKVKSDDGNFEDKVKYKLSDPDAYAGKKCIIVGAGNSAIEAAVALAGLKRDGDRITFTRDNEVILVVRSDFKGDLKLGNKMDIYDCTDAGRVKVYFRTTIKEITDGVVVLIDARSKAEKARAANDYIFALIGGDKPTKFLEGLGVKIG